MQAIHPFDEGDDRSAASSSDAMKEDPPNQPLNEAQQRTGKSAATATATATGDGNGHDDERLTWFIIKVTAIASIGGILFGYDMGSISGALPQLQATFDLSDSQEELIVSILYLGGGFGAMVGGTICDAFGRKMSILGTDVVFLVGATCLCTSNTITQLLIGRFIVGIAIAVSGIADVSYLHESAPQAWRGAIVSVNEVCISLGFLFAYLAGWVWSAKDDNQEWRKIFGVAGLLAAVQFVGMWGMPESPVWLRQQEELRQKQRALHKQQSTSMQDDESEEGDNEHAPQSEVSHGMQSPARSDAEEHLRLQYQKNGNLAASPLTPTLGQAHAEKARIVNRTDSLHTGAQSYQSIQPVGGSTQSLSQSQSQTPPSTPPSPKRTSPVPASNLFAKLKSLYRIAFTTYHTYRKQIIITSFLAIIQQFCGQTNVLNYAPHIFATVMKGHHEHNGDGDVHDHDDATSTRSTVTIGLVKFLVTCLVTWKIERVGRRKLLLGGMATISLGLFCLILAYGGQQSEDDSASDVTHFKTFHLALPGVLLVVCGYSMSFGPLTWLLTSELFPAKIRGRGLGASTILTYMAASFVTRTFLSAQNWLGSARVFALYMGITLLGLVFAYLAIPDTGEKSAQEVEVELCRMPWWRFEHISVLQSAANADDADKDDASQGKPKPVYELYQTDEENSNDEEDKPNDSGDSIINNKKQLQLKEIV